MREGSCRCEEGAILGRRWWDVLASMECLADNLPARGFSDSSSVAWDPRVGK